MPAIASEEQARGVTQVTAAIGEVARSALTTSQQADELAASATEMSSATEMMRRDFDRYKLRKVTAPKPGATSLEDLSPELLAQLRSMMMAQSGSAHPTGYDRTKMNGTHAAVSKASVDRDERGFADF